MSEKSKISNKENFECRAYELSNETRKLEALERQIQYYSELKYGENFNAWIGTPHLSCGLSSEEFESCRCEVINLLKGFYNKKLEKIQKLTDKLKLI